MIRFLYFLIGDPKIISLEHRLFNTVSLFNGALNILGAFTAFYLGNFRYIFPLNFFSGLAMLFMYYMSRKKSIYYRLYWPFNLTILFYLSASWFFNAGSMGGNQYYFIPSIVIAMVLIRDQSVFLVYFIYALVSSVLFGLEYFHKGWILGYQTEMERYQDILGNFIFVQLLTATLVLILRRNINIERKKSDDLLLNILPETIAEELKKTSKVIPKRYESVTILFSDMAGFTKLAESMDPEDLVAGLDDCFRVFDSIAEKHKMEKIKTIGDAYMAAGGLPIQNQTHAIDAVLCGLAMQKFMDQLEEAKVANQESIWELRLGIHTGPVIAGVVGTQKFAYDIWGDSVNTASRLESSGIVGQVNISESTYNLVKDFFDCEARGKVFAKGKGEIEMYFISGIKKDLSNPDKPWEPNERFYQKYEALQII